MCEGVSRAWLPHEVILHRGGGLPSKRTPPPSFPHLPGLPRGQEGGVAEGGKLLAGGARAGRVVNGGAAPTAHACPAWLGCAGGC